MKKMELFSKIIFASLLLLQSCQDNELESIKNYITADLPTFDGDGNGLINIYNINQLNAIRYDLNGNGEVDDEINYDEYIAAFPYAISGEYTGYELMNDLNFKSSNSYNSNQIIQSYNSLSGWLPIGESEDSSYSADFNGNNYSINNLFIYRPTTDNLGLFGVIKGLYKISNLNLINLYIEGADNVGSLVGRVENILEINNISSKGELYGNSNIGGLAGYVSNSEIKFSNTSVSVNGIGDNLVSVGGLVGKVEYSAISNSYSLGDVQVSGMNAKYIGGLVGDNNFAISLINNCYSNSSVIADGIGTSYVGGLVGDNYLGARIRNSYATGIVLAGASSTFVGGLVGENSGTDNITYSYWDTESSGQSISAGGDGKTTSELQSPTTNTGIYSNWSKVVWDFRSSSQYPSLQ